MKENFELLIDEWYGETSDIKDLCEFHVKMIRACEKHFDFVLDIFIRQEKEGV